MRYKAVETLLVLYERLVEEAFTGVVNFETSPHLTNYERPSIIKVLEHVSKSFVGTTCNRPTAVCNESGILCRTVQDT